ncbi:MAG TPA: DUF2306 domain-containing protein [Alloacidobacterium sp.]|nr:DUF2306 domain-containing protein [Alloacidobacterium sp.]
MRALSRSEGKAWLRTDAFPFLLQIGFWLCVLIAVAVVIRRLTALIHPSQGGPPQMAGLDAAFASHTALTLAHILPALLFVVLLPFAFSPRLGASKRVEKMLFPLGIVVGITAYLMSGYAVGGWIERSAVLFFNSLFLFSLVRAWRFMRQGDSDHEQQWMARAVAILLGIATTRPVMGVFFATSSLTHWTPRQFFGIAFWIGFSINTIAIEVWLRTRKTRKEAFA